MQPMIVKRRWVEAVLAVVILALVGGVSFVTFQAERRLQQQKVLFFELQIMRSAINLYKLVNRQNPASLTALATGVYQLPGDGSTHKYIDHAPTGPDGSVKDPFGEAYAYDPATGWVRSQARGYEFW